MGSSEGISYFQDNYDIQFVQQVYNSSVVTFNELKNGLIRHDRPVRIQYNTKDSYKITAKMLGLMDDFKVRKQFDYWLKIVKFGWRRVIDFCVLQSGVPRTGYRGIVSFFSNGRRVYFAPNAEWKQYDPTWS